MSRLSIIAAIAALAFPGVSLHAQVDTEVRFRATLRAPWAPAGFRLPSGLERGGWLARPLMPSRVTELWAEENRELSEADRARRWYTHLIETLTPERPSEPVDIPPPEALAPRPEDLADPAERDPFESLSDYADVWIDLTGRLEIGLDHLRNARCTAADAFSTASGCVGGFPTPTVDQQANVKAGGIIGDRIHLAVDFDTEREFSANNNISVFYQGLEDEILRRVDVGTVSFEAPASRFITSGIPANSFGVQAEAQLGPLNVRSIFAQQKGSAVRTRRFTVGDATTQPVDFDTRDVDFESGRAFFVVNPVDMPGYPDVDILSIRREALPLPLQVSVVRVYRLRAQGSQAEENPNLGGIDAVAVRPDSPQRIGPFSWELLVEGTDFFLDPSGVWFALNTRVGLQDFLAVSYVTTSGDTVGTFPAVNGEVDTLELIYEPRRGTTAPTFPYEMRNWYRLGSMDFDRVSIGLGIEVRNSETPLDGEGTYLSRLGLSLSTDPSTIDEFNRVFPRERDPDGGAPIRDLFVVFPHLLPFADSVRLQQGELNDSLYKTPTFLLRTQGPASKFALRVHYEVSGAGDRTNLSLGALQVRAGSERLSIGERLLTRGADYEIDYSLGQVTFLNPDSLFVGPTQVTAEFEENQLFDDAPKSIFGFSSTYSLGRIGDINAIGIFQRERTVSTRPTLGFEPEAQFIGGLSTDLRFRMDGMTQALDALPLLNTSVESALEINGEIAVSRPSANQRGVAYVEDFEREPSNRLRLAERAFQLGSAPSSGRGLPATHLSLSGHFEPADAVPLVWQNLIRGPEGLVQFGPQDIDSTIILTGTGISVETTLWLSLKPDTIGGAPDPATGNPRWLRLHTPGPRWRSITQPLGGGSGVGVDLSRTEFLEFWVLEDGSRTARSQDAYLVFDFGSVFEDAVRLGPAELATSGADTAFFGLQQVGTNQLDTEKDSLTNVFNAQLHDIGLRGDLVDTIINQATGQVVEGLPLCDLRSYTDVTAFDRGDLLARCTRGNGVLNTEDLDGDNRLDVNVGVTQEDFVRYVLPVGDERFFVRRGGNYIDENGRTHTWRLYRVPFREDTVQVGRPNLFQVKAVRLTMVAPDQAETERELSVAISRMRLVGSPWIKRAAAPIQGLSGSRAELSGEVIASVITTENTDLGYESPPGVLNEAERADAGLGFGTQQINEKSLRLLATDLRAGQRGEAFLRFIDAADKNFLKYRELRVWSRGRGAGWEEGDLEFIIKAGRDEYNFYMYRTPVRSVTWEPEIIIELDKWTELRAMVEAAWLSGAPPSGAAECGGDSTAYVACDGPYMVQVRDAGTSPPNLARVSEIAVGIYRAQETVFVEQAELWVDDIRLADMIDDAGVAAALDVRLAAADLAEITFDISRVDDLFRQLGENPSYVTDEVRSFGSIFRLDKLMPESWGYNIPLVVQHTGTDADPYYIQNTDVRADQLPNLRQPGSSFTNVEMSLTRVRRGTSFLERALLNPLSVQASRTTGKDVSSLTEARTSNQRVHADYSATPRARTVRAVPQFLVDFVDWLPGFISNSEFANALRSSRLRWNPQRFRLTSTLVDNLTERNSFRVPVILQSDSLQAPARRVMHVWRTTAELDLRPFSTFGLRASYETTRDLHDYGDSTTVGRLLDAKRQSLLGRDIGFERNRSLRTGLDVSPAVSSWFRPRLVILSTYSFSRDPTAKDPVRAGTDSSGAFLVPEAALNSSVRELGTTVDLARLIQGIAGDSSGVTVLTRGILPADVSLERERNSNFNQIAFSPDVAYHFAFGGIDDFRQQEGTLAASAAEATTFTATGGSRLPLGGQMRLNFREGRNTVWYGRAEGQQRNHQTMREWPSLTMSWVYTPSSGINLFISSVSAQMQYRVINRRSLRPEFDPVDGGDGLEESTLTEDNTTVIAPTITLSWPGGVTTSASYSSATRGRVTSGNTINTDQAEWRGTLGFGFRPPESIIRMRSQIRTNVTFDSSKRAVCLVRAGSDECRSVSDSRRHELAVRLDTGLSEMLRGGANFNYVVNDLRHTSDRLSQVVFSIFLDLRLFAGEIR